ncbi:MAG: DNA-binding transcriptional regulator, LysR family [Rhodospirillales bacterium]|nr:DNA-binding transcriptional regulator, LysR family [Rhodospirillales bacterium]
MLAIPPGLDPDLLRAFVLIAEGGSVTRAAARVGRTQSAVSMQIKRLEEFLGKPLLMRNGRGLSPTPHGAWLLDRARQVLALNDQIVAGFWEPALVGHVRLGVPDDYALRWLPGILADFAETHPAVEVEVVCFNSDALADRMELGLLDLALLSEGHSAPGWTGQEIWRGPLRWVGSARHAAHRRDPLPLVLARDGCTWREAALNALAGIGRASRVTYNSATQSGCFALALAGLGVTVSTTAPLPEGLAWLGTGDGLPELGTMGIELLQSRCVAGSAAAVALAAGIVRGFAEAP